MLWLVTNWTARLVLSIGAAFSFGMLFFGGLKSLVGPIGVLLIDLAAMPLLAYGFWLNFSAIAQNLEIAEEA
jgi:hypothetical protein